jgi:hypothetical protein
MGGGGKRGRNDPCACGSGRKYKTCCLRRDETSDSTRLLLRRVEEMVVPAVLRFASERCDEEWFAEAEAEFRLWSDSRDIGPYEPAFVPWILFDYVCDEIEPARRSRWPTEPIGRVFLREEGPRLPEIQRRFIETALRQPFTFLVVDETRPGCGLRLRDLLTGAVHDVLEATASATLTRNTVVFARPVPMAEGTILFGIAPYALPPRCALQVIDERDAMRGEGRHLDVEEVADRDIELRELYFDLLDAAMAPPRLQNTDGEPLEFATVRWRLHCPPEEAVRAIGGLAEGISVDELLEDAERDAAGEVYRVNVPWIRPGNARHAALPNTSLASIDVVSGEITRTGELEGSRRAAS